MSHRLLEAIRLLLAAAFCLGATLARADAWATGMWFNPDEPGWGMSVIQQGGTNPISDRENDTLFVVLYVYDAEMKPTWFVASGLTSVDSSDASPQDLALYGGEFYKGTLYQTSGPWFGGSSFNPAQVTLKSVGDLSFGIGTDGAYHVRYSIGGTQYNKRVVQQLWAYTPMDGSYLALYPPKTTCTLPNTNSNNGQVYIDITSGGDPVGSTVTLRFRDPGVASCDVTGSVAPDGTGNVISGTYTCTNGPTGKFTAHMAGGHDGLYGYIAIGCGASIAAVRVPAGLP